MFVTCTAWLWLAWAEAIGGGGAGGELRFALRSDPKTVDPLLSSDQASEMLVHLTHERLIRINRKTGKFEPALAESWKILDQGRKVSLQLRKGVRFSDGSPFTAADVAYTIRRVADPVLNSPKAGVLRQGGVEVAVLSPDRVTLTFPAVVPSIERELEGLPILSASKDLKATLGPFSLVEHKAGSYLTLKRNPNYWRAESGAKLPYLDTLRIDIQANGDIELERFRRGELHLLESIDPAAYAAMEKDMPAAVKDAGPSNDVEFLWFNQSPESPLPKYKLAWFQSREFRRAMSAAIHRDDIVRLVYQNRATAAAGLTRPSNKSWYKPGLAPHAFDLEQARKLLKQAGFQWKGETLVDGGGRAVEFSVITNAGNKARAKIAAMLQQDLSKLGVKVNVSTFDFPSLVERINRTGNYEACVLGFVNQGEDPMSAMNMLLSSGPQHMWRPGQKQPATAWEAEIDKAMLAQASTADAKKRKVAFERVQQILSDEAPVLFLAHRNALTAASPKLKNVEASAEYPRLLWRPDRLAWGER